MSERIIHDWFSMSERIIHNWKRFTWILEEISETIFLNQFLRYRKMPVSQTCILTCKNDKTNYCILCKYSCVYDGDLDNYEPKETERTYDTSIQRLMDVFREPTTDEPKEDFSYAQNPNIKFEKEDNDE